MTRLLSLLTLLLSTGLSSYASNQDGPKASSVSVDNVPVSSDAVSAINAATSTAGANDESSNSSSDDDKPTKKKKSKKGGGKKSSSKKANKKSDKLPFSRDNVKCPKGLEDEDIKNIFKGYSYEGFIKASTDGDMDLMNGLMRKPWGFYKGHDGVHYAVYAFKPEAADMSNFVDTSKLAPYKMVRLKIPQYCALYTEASPDEANSSQHEPIGLVVSRASTHKPKPLDPGAVKVQAVYDILKKDAPVSNDNSSNTSNDLDTHNDQGNTDTSETKIFNKLDGTHNDENGMNHSPAGGDNSEASNGDSSNNAEGSNDLNAANTGNENPNDNSLDVGTSNNGLENSTVPNNNPEDSLSLTGENSGNENNNGGGIPNSVDASNAEGASGAIDQNAVSTPSPSADDQNFDLNGNGAG